MDGILITIIVITAFLVYKMISSSRKQEGYKRWKATSSGKEEKTTKVKWEHGAWLRHALGETVPERSMFKSLMNRLLFGVPICWEWKQHG